MPSEALVLFTHKTPNIPSLARDCFWFIGNHLKTKPCFREALVLFYLQLLKNKSRNIPSCHLKFIFVYVLGRFASGCLHTHTHTLCVKLLPRTQIYARPGGKTVSNDATEVALRLLEPD